MLDIRAIRQDPEGYRARLARRGADAQLDALLAADARRRAAIQRNDELRAARGEAQKAMQAADKGSPEFAEFRDRMRLVGQDIKAATDAQKAAEDELDEILLGIPNVPLDVVPDGKGEEGNVVRRVWGQKPALDFEPQEHWALGEALGVLDFAAAAKISGARFAVYRGALARMERALAAYMLDMHTTQHGYLEVFTPFLVNSASMAGTGQFPKFKDDAFQCADDDLVLVPTAEVPVTNLHRDEILESDALPIQYTGWTACFRREAGGYGRDTRGLIRQHQFQKVELVHFVRPEDSEAALEALTSHAEAVLQGLGLHYRVMDLCAGDLGFAATRTYDLEVWLPGQGAYREISSCSNCWDFQARRAKIRHRKAGDKPALIHTLNGSGLAVGRTVVAILENYQQADGTVRIPDALRPYMGGLEQIS